jgi:hypothetical protein
VTGILYDSVDVTQIPAGAEAVAGYTTGLYPHMGESLCQVPERAASVHRYRRIPRRGHTRRRNR